MSNFDDFFRSIKWDSRFTWFEALLVMDGGEEILFYVKSVRGTAKEPLEQVVDFFNQIVQKFNYLVNTITQKYFSIYKESWEVDNSVTMEEFTDQICLDVVTFYSVAEKSLTFSVGNLFGSHVIVVEIGAGFEVESVMLES